MTQYRSCARTLEAQAQWGGSSAGKLEDAVGAANVQLIPGGVQVRAADGHWHTLLPGWWAAVAGGDVIVLSDHAFRAQYEPVR